MHRRKCSVTSVGFSPRNCSSIKHTVISKQFIKSWAREKMCFSAQYPNKEPGKGNSLKSRPSIRNASEKLSKSTTSRLIVIHQLKCQIHLRRHAGMGVWASKATAIFASVALAFSFMTCNVCSCWQGGWEDNKPLLTNNEMWWSWVC